MSLQTADRVIMRFDTKADATRAVETLRQVAQAEAIRDASAAIPGPIPGASGLPNNPAGNPLNGASEVPDAAAPGGTTRPGVGGAGNGPGGPLNPNNAPEIAGEILARRAEPPVADRQFLADHIAGYEQVLTGQLFARADVMLGSNLKVGGGVHGTAAERIIRRVDLPQDGGDGKITYSAEGQLAVTGRERINLNSLTPVDVNGHVINMQDIADIRGRTSVSWNVPANQFNGAGQPFPDADVLSNGGWRHPDEIRTTLQFNARAQPLDDVSRSDQAQVILETTLKNPDDHAAQVLGSLGRGDFGDLRQALAGLPADTSVLARTQFVERDGARFRADAGFDVDGVGGMHVTLVGEFGNDDVVARSDRRWTGAPAATEPTTGPAEPPPSGTPGQLVVVPRDGVSVRPTPGTDEPRTGVLQHGTFAQPTGQRATDGTGREWVEVRSTDVADKPIQGWVAAEYTAPHPEGGMDATGRINPDLEHAGYREVQVKPGDTIWDISRREGTDFHETVALNRDHIIQPDLIFPGDTVYLPGPQAPVAAQPSVTTPPTTAPSANPPAGSTPPGSTGSGSPTGSPSAGSPSAGSPSAGSPPTGAPSTGTPSTGASSAGSPPGSGTPSGTAPGTNPGPGSGTNPGSASGTPGGTAPGTGTTPTTGAPTTGAPTSGAATPNDVAGRPNLEAIQREFQVREDPGGMVTYAPLGGLFGSREMTATEARLLEGRSLLDQRQAKENVDRANQIANGQFPNNPVPSYVPSNLAALWQGNDGHRDVMRHAFWSASLARDLGPEFARQFTTAHEGTAERDQNADREAMDLYNNSVGIRIAQQNPGASDEVLTQRIREAIDRGEFVVIDRNGNLAWSDRVPVGGHGLANDAGVPGVIPTPDGRGAS
ncbi:LysM peptidoglycan-binding domain-containing protein [Roseomonas sp. CCTCC AB2023176]|uniref:LysM peptidoglycan-binding domain-containing protein n=1 Tax=Roseomonas sp. CCTCC AB2023176 TaxID=3342640 RepID=UPI0035DB19F5